MRENDPWDPRSIEPVDFDIFLEEIEAIDLPDFEPAVLLDAQDEDLTYFGIDSPYGEGASLGENSVDHFARMIKQIMARHDPEASQDTPLFPSRSDPTVLRSARQMIERLQTAEITYEDMISAQRARRITETMVMDEWLRERRERLGPEEKEKEKEKGLTG